MTTAVIRGNEGTDFCLVVVAQIGFHWGGGGGGGAICWSLDLGSPPDRSLSFLFRFDHIGLCMLTSNLIHPHQVN